MNVDKKQIGVIATPHCDGGKIAMKLAELGMRDNVEIIVIDDKKVSEGFIPRNNPLPIEPIKMVEWQNYPETRAERRAKARKKKRR